MTAHDKTPNAPEDVPHALKLISGWSKSVCTALTSLPPMGLDNRHSNTKVMWCAIF